ncbi:MAG TPA: hypothetical protein VLG76_05250 [Rhabdochlamydiaceae bacterium]|nr:hypothetical protein [Rhabdochlamydiaceae bacterium]
MSKVDKKKRVPEENVKKQQQVVTLEKERPNLAKGKAEKVLEQPRQEKNKSDLAYNKKQRKK